LRGAKPILKYDSSKEKHWGKRTLKRDMTENDREVQHAVGRLVFSFASSELRDEWVGLPSVIIGGFA